MAYKTKAMIEEENERLRSYLSEVHVENRFLKREISALKFPANIVNTMAITVQKTAGLVENLLQSIPSVHKFSREGGGKDEENTSN